MTVPAADEPEAPDTRPPSRRRWLWVGALGAVVAAGLALLLWVQRDASWPPELDDPATASLFSSVEQPTAADLVLLDELVTDIALGDDVVLGLLGGRAWPDPDIDPVFWTEAGADGRSVLIGGRFELELGGVEYVGPWPTAGCRRGAFRGTVRTVEAFGLDRVSVTVDLTFDRVTHVVIPPGEPGSASLVYRDDYETLPWYSGRCPFFSLPD